MLADEVAFINEAFNADKVTPEQLDKLLAQGWRHFGIHFFRYSYGFYELDVRRVIPLRIRLDSFTPSKSQRRVLRSNADLTTTIRPISVTSEAETLFEIHKGRFKSGVPNSLLDFLSHEPASVPCEAMEVSVCDGEKLVAVSYFDIGRKTTSGVYAMFDPGHADRSLGIFTMLKEIEFSVENGKEFYYQGYSYEGSSFYDYKKRFRGTEAYDWYRAWESYSEEMERESVKDLK